MYWEILLVILYSSIVLFPIVSGTVNLLCYTDCCSYPVMSPSELAVSCVIIPLAIGCIIYFLDKDGEITNKIITNSTPKAWTEYKKGLKKDGGGNDAIDNISNLFDQTECMYYGHTWYFYLIVSFIILAAIASPILLLKAHHQQA